MDAFGQACLYGYVKSKREHLTPQQVKVLAELVKDLKDG